MMIAMAAMMDELSFDNDSFQQLLSDTDSETVLIILAHFHDTLSLATKQMTEALAANDFDMIWKSAHKLSGSAELLGFKAYGGMARKISYQLMETLEMPLDKTEIQTFLRLTDRLKAKVSQACLDWPAHCL